MDDKEGNLVLGGVTSFGCLPKHLGEGDYNVAEVGGVVGGCGEEGVRFVGIKLGIVVALPGAGVGGGEGEDVGDFVVAAIAGVEGPDGFVVAKSESELAVPVGEGGIEGG